MYYSAFSVSGKVMTLVADVGLSARPQAFSLDKYLEIQDLFG